MVVIFDIEATCEDRNINKNYNMETIEIGAVKVYNGKVIDEFQTFIEPEYTDRLTDYCSELTGITYSDLEGAPKFTEAILEFHKFIIGCDIYSCGNFDKKFLINEIKEKGARYEHKLVSNSIKSSHKNLKTLFSQITNNKKCGMIEMAEILSIQLDGNIHRALDDAKNLTKIYLELEKIRESKLREVIGNKIEKIIQSINNNHDNYILNIIDDNLISCFDKFTGETEKYTFLSFIDNWSILMIIDITERKLKYLSNQDLSALRRYSIMSES